MGYRGGFRGGYRPQQRRGQQQTRPGQAPNDQRSSNQAASVPNTSAVSLVDIIGGASRTTTPASLDSHKSPTTEQSTQAGGAGKRGDKKNVKPIPPPGQRNYQRKSNSQERRNSRGDSQDYYRNQNRQAVGRPQHQGPQSPHPNFQQQQQQQQQQRGGGWNNRGQMTPRGRPRGGTGGYKSNQGQPNQGKNKNTLKFENDYDFEQTNTQFEELRSQLAKVKIEGTSKTEINGDIVKNDNSGNETGAGENEQEEEHKVFYDKSKSFFDNIACEAVERAKGKSQRTDWRTERKLNSETFGVAATRRGKVKIYVAVFICLTTKAVYLEVVGALTTDAFIAALKRFMARRGKSRKIYSDNGINSTGANNELKKLCEVIISEQHNDKVQAYLSNESVEWHFSPPSSPHFGGIWEAAVKSFKFHLKRVAKQTLFSYEHFNTLIIQIEAILNSRPLTTLSQDPNDLVALTPAHFLIGATLLGLPERDFLATPINRLFTFQHIQRVKQDFWKRWSKEYINELSVRRKWYNGDNPIKEGSIVRVRDDKYILVVIVKFELCN